MQPAFQAYELTAFYLAQVQAFEKSDVTNAMSHELETGPLLKCIAL